MGAAPPLVRQHLSAALEGLSRAAGLLSILAILALQLVVNPDITWLLRVLAAAAFTIGLIAARSEQSLAVWAAASVLGPGTLFALAGREGPVLDVVWLAGLAGTLARGSWTRWSLPPVWRVLLGGWALTLSMAWPVLAAREAAFTLHGFADRGAITSYAGMTAPQTIAWTLSVVLVQLAGLFWLDAVHARWSSRPERLPEAVRGLWIAIAGASLAAVYQGVVDPRFLTSAFWAERQRATGTMLDANAYGVAAAAAAAASLVLVGRAGNPRARWLGGLACVITTAGLWMSGSRTALLVLATAAGLWILRAPRWRVVWPVLVPAAAALLLTVIAGASGPLGRLGELPDGVQLSALPDKAQALGELWRRGGYGTAAISMLREHPLAGIGIGSYHVVVPDYAKRLLDRELPFDNAQNWWRHVLAEMGLFGAVPVLIWSGLLALRVFRRPSVSHAGPAADAEVRCLMPATGGEPAEPAAAAAAALAQGRSVAPPSKNQPREAIDAEELIVRGLLLGLGLCSLFGMPTQNPAVLLAFFALAARLGIAPVSPLRPATATLAWVLVAVLAGAYATSHVVLARGPLSVAERARRAHRAYIAGAYEPEFADGISYRWTGEHARFLLPRTSRWLILRIWSQHPDASERPVQVTVGTACEVVLSEWLRSHEPVVLGLWVPDSLDPLDFSVHVSRTWTPADFGAEDTRELGVAVAPLFVDADIGSREPRRVVLRDCAAGRAGL